MDRVIAGEILVWDFDQAQRVFISMVDARTWPKIGGERIPTPVTSARYEEQGIPWFDLQGLSDMPPSESLQTLKSVQLGMIELGADVENEKLNVTKPLTIPRKVIDGVW